VPANEAAIQPFSGVILAGGRSERFGRDKASMYLGGKSLVQRAVDTLSQLSKDIICIARPDQTLQLTGARLVCDSPDVSGVLAAIEIGLQSARCSWSLVVACDMPFISLPLVCYMLSLVEGHDVVVPCLEVGLEPLHAFYHRNTLASITRAISDHKKRVVSFYESVRVRRVNEAEIRLYDPHLRSFYNINTIADLDQIRGWNEETQKPIRADQGLSAR